MKLIKRLLAGLLNFVVLSVLLIGSCVGPGYMYMQSPRWFIDDINSDEVKTKSFFVANMKGESEGTKELDVTLYRYRPDSSREGNSDVQYYMPEEHLLYSWGPGEGSANIDVINESQGSQLIQVFVVGDTPWSSLSEYRVVDNKVYPLRHAHSVAWLLLGIIFCLFLINPLSKPIGRGIKRLVRIETIDEDDKNI
jgi:hypothetical protein